jgi:hypothetical protein
VRRLATKAGTFTQHVVHDLLLGCRQQPDVDEARPGDLDVGHPALVGGQAQQARLELLRHLARVGLERLGQLHGGRDRQVAVSRHLGRLEGRLAARPWDQLFQCGRQARQQFLFDSQHGGRF